MIDIEDFGRALGIDGDGLLEAYEIFSEELRAPQKTLAARAAELAAGLRQAGLEEPVVMAAVQQLAEERRR